MGMAGEVGRRQSAAHAHSLRRGRVIGGSKHHQAIAHKAKVVRLAPGADYREVFGQQLPRDGGEHAAFAERMRHQVGVAAGAAALGLVVVEDALEVAGDLGLRREGLDRGGRVDSEVGREVALRDDGAVEGAEVLDEGVE